MEDERKHTNDTGDATGIAVTPSISISISLALVASSSSQSKPLPLQATSPSSNQTNTNIHTNQEEPENDGDEKDKENEVDPSLLSIARASKLKKKKDRAKRKKAEHQLQQLQITQSTSHTTEGGDTSEASEGKATVNTDGVNAELSELKAQFDTNPMHAYFNESNGTKLEFTPLKGRHVIATRPIPIGNVVFCMGAYGSVVNDRFVHAFCSRCFQTGPTMFCCANCQHARFCSVKCKNAMANMHNLECAALGRLAKVKTENETAPLRMLIRICYLYAQEKIYPISSSSTHSSTSKKVLWRAQPGECWDAARSLITHLSQHSSSTKSSLLMVILQLQQDIIKDEQIWRDNELTPQVLLETLLQIQCNGHTITDGDKNHVGLGLFIPAAYLNHSCRPNCVYWFDHNGSMVMQSIRPISPGEEITYSYIDLYASRSDRAQQLAQTYFISSCQCSRCLKTHEKSSEDALMRSLVCSACSTNPLNEWKKEIERSPSDPLTSIPSPSYSILKYNKSNPSSMYCPNGSCNKVYSKSALDELVSNTVRLAQQADLMAQSGDILDSIRHYEERIFFAAKPITPNQPFFHPYHATIFNCYLRMIRILESLTSPIDVLSRRFHFASIAIDCLDSQQLSSHPESASLFIVRAQAAQHIRKANDATNQFVLYSPPKMNVREIGSLTFQSPANASSSSSSSASSSSSTNMHPVDLLVSSYSDYSRAHSIYSICYGRTHSITQSVANEIRPLESLYQRHIKKGDTPQTDAIASKGKKKQLNK